MLVMTAVTTDPFPSVASPGTVLLDTSRPDAENRRTLLFTRPLRVLTAEKLADVNGLLVELEEAVATGWYAAGYLGYEAGYAFEPHLFQGGSEGRWPLGWFGLYESPVELHPGEVQKALHGAGRDAFEISRPSFQIDRGDYLAALQVVKDHIRAGDVYQVNFTDEIAFDFAGRPLALYRHLRQQQHVPYGAYIDTGAGQLLSCSPELFFRRAGGRIWTRPMKGTAPRGRTLEEDQRRARELAEDSKSQAENLMIVDLLRNDLSRCCRPGSVHVPALFQVEHYETLLQMTSTVEGELRAGTGYADIFRALFPCGSVTGAPKLRAMQLVQQIERKARGPYCGAIGYMAPGGEAGFIVAIRTALLQEGQGRMGVGSGVVWDSDPEAEYDECRLKGHFLTEQQAPGEDFKLIETMQWAEGRLLRARFHVNRLQASARYFGFPFHARRFREQIEEATGELPGEGCFKVRATLARTGRLEVTSDRCRQQKEEPWRAVVAGSRRSSDNVFLYHKTTNRDFYEAPYRRARREGFDEVIFLNERGEVTEGSRSNIFILEEGLLYTPPVACGLLAGTYRGYLLEHRSEATERVLQLHDLHSADAVYLCNALWGLKECTVAETGEQGWTI